MWHCLAQTYCSNLEYQDQAIDLKIMQAYRTLQEDSDEYSLQNVLRTE